MKTLEELIEHLDKEIQRSHENGLARMDLIIARSLAADALSRSNSYKQAILDANSLRDQLGEAQKELDGSVFVPHATSGSVYSAKRYVGTGLSKFYEVPHVNAEAFAFRGSSNEHWVLASDYEKQTKELEAALAEIELWKSRLDNQYKAHRSDMTSTCSHGYPERECAIFDGMCPICSAKEIEAARAELRVTYDLVAVANRDGGHYRESHGTRAAVDRGIARYVDILSKLDVAQAEIERLTHALKVRKGWKLVPIEPTQEMLKAVGDLAFTLNNQDRSVPIRNGYIIMVAAAPSPAE